MSDKKIPSAFKQISMDDLSEYKAEGFLFEHIQTGCQVYHVANDDEENLFSFSFRTPPEDSSGVAHILEHSVLCGSRKYPVKDPFLSMMKGSVNTFLNAMTYPDKTLYPAASVLEKDFFNLMDVYGDAVFFPQLKEEVFRQEGHRLERDEQGNLNRTGIVYNEMKGNYSSQDSIAYEWAIRSVFPDNAYAVDSGGDPRCIPELTYEKFKKFHETYYHPSNCKIFLYGNIQSSRILQFLDENFLSHFQKKEIDSTVAFQKSWDSPRNIEAGWPLGEDEDPRGKSTVSMNWKTFNAEDPVRSLSLSILTEILMGNAGAPLYKALLESGLGDDLSPVSGVDFDLNEAVFSIAMRGTDPQKAEQIKDLVFSTLKDLSTNGFDPDLVESCLRIVEFRAREVKGGGPFGMRLLRKIMKGWNYDLPPVQSLLFDSVMAEVRRRSREKSYFESLLKEWVLDNPHWSLVTIKPDQGMSRMQDEELRSEMEDILKNMSAEDINDLDAKNENLKEFQEAEDEGSVPFLQKDDIPVKVRNLDFSSESNQVFTTLSQGIFSNGILYNDMAFSFKGLDEKLYPYIPLFIKMLSGCGLPGISYDVISREISLKTGGFGCSVETGHKVGDAPFETPESYLYIRLKMLESQKEEALDLASSLILNADFDNHSRMEQILMELWNDLKSSLLPGGHSYVLLRNNSRLSSAARLEDLLYGIGQLQFLEKLIEKKERMTELSALMKSLRNRIFSSSGMTLSLTMDEALLQEHKSSIVEYWMQTLPVHSDTSEIQNPLLDEISLPPAAPSLSEAEGLAIPAMVGYVGKALRGTSLTDENHGAQVLLSVLLKLGPLWEKIRMKGGAYGAFSTHSGLDQTFSFATYRDPEIENSLDAFKEGLEEFLVFSDEEELEKALITVIGKDMKPLCPSEKSMIVLKRSLYLITDELRQNKRDQLLSCNARDIAVIAKHFLSIWEEDSVGVMAHPDKLDEASGKWPGFSRNRISLPQ